MKGLLVLAAMMFVAGCTSREDRAQELAFSSCAAKLKDVAKNPSSARIPAASSLSVQDRGLRLEWNHGSGLAFTNGFGALLDTTATCSTSSDGVRVRELIVDGGTVFLDAVTLAERQRVENPFGSSPVSTWDWKEVDAKASGARSVPDQ